MIERRLKVKNRNLNHADNWETPIDFYKDLDKEFNFDFDPCPIMYNEITPDKDGLLIEWGQRNFVNPPYSQKLKEAFILKALEESKKGKLSVMLLPVSTSTKIFHEVILPNAKDIRFVRGRLAFAGINTKGQYVNWHNSSIDTPDGVEQVRNSGMHDSMIVIF